ncbi:Multiple RNA-binding domain-containing protein 1 [Glycine soja]|uniref:Multiple RNA-binding domain-containing protein 1 n=1 Tax=Glycine soja TaxID=3848 RepID=A0A445J6J7_GLYSO|nr:Multiple RNA-binding domain-containing protein 1 [Glycine soja]
MAALLGEGEGPLRSRICVKCLPEYVMEDRLRELFSEKGEITDVKLMRTNGKSRQFAFIGFCEDHQAQEAIRYFNKNYLGASKITCEACCLCYFDIVDIDDPQLQQFLLVMQPRARVKLWVNGTPIASSNVCNKVSSDAIHPILVQSGSLIGGLSNNPKHNKSRTSRNGAEELDLEDQEDTCGKGVAHDKAQVNPEAEKVVSESCRLFVHNLPYTATTSEEELQQHVGKVHVVVNKSTKLSKGIAYILFSGPEIARRDAPLYLEWAPLYLEWAPSNILSQSSTFKKMKMNSGIGENDVKQLKLEQNVLRISYVDIGPDRVQARTLFVKNLNFNTTDESLRKHFSENMKEGAILSVKVKKHLKNGKNVSMGYGFVEIYSEGQVQKTIEKGKSLTKLHVKDVAFEATEKSLRELFKPFGEKFGCHSHRGFAFVEYVTPKEAENALSTLQHTHILGWHLKIERTNVDPSLDEQRAQTAAQFSRHMNFKMLLCYPRKERTSVS